MTRQFFVPEQVSRITNTLEDAGYEAYLVGGCVRDLVIDKEPKDWDVTTNATPEIIQEIFQHTYYDNHFGTVGVVNDDAEYTAYHVIEVTPYRVESSYSDARRPDTVEFSKNIEDDLKRRDFTVNAMAYNVSRETFIDLFEGQKDLENRRIRAVGEPVQRFNEDALRILRAVRLATELEFEIDDKTKAAIKDSASQLTKISAERIRDEITRIIDSPNPENGFHVAHELGILPYTLAELEEGVGIEQNQAHSFTVFEHNLKTLQHAADKDWSTELRLAALLHDIGKPRSRRFSREKNDWTFHGHEVIGAKMTKKILDRLKFSRETSDKVCKLVRWHMFFSDPDQVTLSAVRRTIRNVGRDNITDLMHLRICDRIGTGRPKEQPFRFRKYQSMIEEALRDPISVQMLKIDGGRIMEITGEKPGPRLGYILHALLEEVLDDPKRNSEEYLEKRAVELAECDDSTLQSLGEQGKQRQKEEDAENIAQLRNKYHVK